MESNDAMTTGIATGALVGLSMRGTPVLVDGLQGRPDDLLGAFFVASFLIIMPMACAVIVRETARRTGREADTGHLAFVAYLTLIIPVIGLTIGGDNEAIEIPIIVFAGAVAGFIFSLPWVSAAIFKSPMSHPEEE